MTTSEILTLLRARGFDFKRALGQHFLHDDNIIQAILEASGVTAESRVLEIGPGAGVMTAPLSRRAGRVLAIELDRALLPVLETTLHGIKNVAVVQGDALKVDLPALFAEHLGEGPVEVISNLPYSITTPVLQRLLEGDLPLTRITVMVQSEAAQRICAPPGGKEYGPLAILARYRCDIERVLEVPRSAFVPPPHVDSAVLRMQVREPVRRPLDESFFLRLVHLGFTMRRKTLANNLQSGLGISREKAIEALEAATLSPQVRAEAVPLEALIALSDVLRQLP